MKGGPAVLEKQGVQDEPSEAFVEQGGSNDERDELLCDSSQTGNPLKNPSRDSETIRDIMIREASDSTSSDESSCSPRVRGTSGTMKSKASKGEGEEWDDDGHAVSYTLSKAPCSRTNAVFLTPGAASVVRMCMR